MKRLFTTLLAVALMAPMLFALVPAANAATVSFKVGDYLTLGEYDGEAILWRCVDVDTNGPLMLADKVLCQKPFDVPGSDISGSHGRGCVENEVIGANRQAQGSNYWGDSNLRCWLNSTAKAGETGWTCGNAPAAVSGYDNSEKYAYDEEAGFLSGFSAAERALIKSVSQKQLLSSYEYSEDNTREEGYHLYVTDVSNCVQNYKKAYSEKLSDKVFLLDVNQINRVYKKRSVLGSDYYIARDTDGRKIISWLRSPYARVSDSFVRIVDAGGNVGDSVACYPYGGVRPAFYLDQSESFAGLGTKKSPYYPGKNKYEGIGIGDYLKMGSYDGETLLWRCINIDDNGPLMLLDKTYTDMEFDAAGSHDQGGSHARSHTWYVRVVDGQNRIGAFSTRHEYGSNYWGDSNLRCWLNSNESAGNVEWTCYNPPSYEKNAGFLSDFTKGEQYAIKEVKLRTVLDGYEYHQNNFDINAFKLTLTSYPFEELYNSDYARCYSEMLDERVFVLDLQQLNDAFENDAFIDESYMYANEGERYWLRVSNSKLGGVEQMAMTDSKNIRACDYAYTKNNMGARPAFYLNVDALTLSGSGTKSKPYKVTDVKLPKEPEPTNTPNPSETPEETPLVTPEETAGVTPNSEPTNAPEPTPDEKDDNPVFASVFASGNVPFLLITSALYVLTAAFIVVWRKKTPYKLEI